MGMQAKAEEKGCDQETQENLAVCMKLRWHMCKRQCGGQENNSWVACLAESKEYGCNLIREGLAGLDCGGDDANKCDMANSMIADYCGESISPKVASALLQQVVKIEEEEEGEE